MRSESEIRERIDLFKQFMDSEELRRIYAPYIQALEWSIE